MGNADRERQARECGQESQLPRHFRELLAEPCPRWRRFDDSGARDAVLRQGRTVAGDPRRPRGAGVRFHRSRRLRRRSMSASTMETYFHELAALLDRSLEPGELYTCRLDAEASDFVRLNRGKVRQAGSVAQRYVRPHLI